MNRLKLWWYTKINTKNTIFFPNIPLGKADDTYYQFDNEKVYLYTYLNNTVALKEETVTNLNLELVNHPSTLAAMRRRDLISYKNGQISHGNFGALFEYKDNDYLVMWDKDFIARVYKIL
ncbi:MAG TPA: hypothetical protein P5513_03450 [Candidatus Diapherotrites archaeon]|nr:hypothetical protein [Candidatus Diapherotrites archaeon]